MHVELGLSGRTASFLALVDTGNCLTDPVSGAEVMIASPRALLPLFPRWGSLLESKDPVQMVEESSRNPEFPVRLRLLPYKNLSGEGLLPVFRADEVRVEKKVRQGLLVGISSAASNDGFDAVIP